jgi:hypothetical protein
MSDWQGSPEDVRQRQELSELMAAMRVLRGGELGAKVADPVETGIAKLPGRGEWVKAAPGVAIVCGTVILLSFVAVFVALAITGTPTDAFFRLINMFLNALGAIATLVTLCVAMIHARRTMENRRIAIRGQEEAHRAADSAVMAADTAAIVAEGMNGDLDTRIVRAVRAALDDTNERGRDQDIRGKAQDVRGRAQDARDDEQNAGGE